MTIVSGPKGIATSLKGSKEVCSELDSTSWAPTELIAANFIDFRIVLCDVSRLDLKGGKFV